jgi:hypothetical protein
MTEKFLTLDKMESDMAEMQRQLQEFREAMQTFSGQQAQIFERLGSIENTISGMRSDILLLENKNFDRHLDILCRLTEKEVSG